MGTCVKGAIITILNWIYRSLLRMFKTALINIKENNRDSQWLSFWLCCCKPCLHFFEYWSKYQCNLTIMHVNLKASILQHFNIVDLDLKRQPYTERIGQMELRNRRIYFREI